MLLRSRLKNKRNDVVPQIRSFLLFTAKRLKHKPYKNMQVQQRDLLEISKEASVRQHSDDTELVLGLQHGHD